MRIAVATWNRRILGGVEVYLNRVVSALHHEGFEVGLFHEMDVPVYGEPIQLPNSVPAWSVDELGSTRALTELINWRPDVIYAHGFQDTDLEKKILRVAPGVFFAHGYYGTCISGSKTFKRPITTPCDRRFGWRCLLHYFPHNCGGSNPLTMLKNYTEQSTRLKSLQHYSAVITHSEHMKSEFIKNGLMNVSVVSFPGFQKNGSMHQVPIAPDNSEATFPSETPGNWRLLFVGRMDYLKGGSILLDALPRVIESLNTKLTLTFVGDGPARREWQRKAERSQQANDALDIQFIGWIASTQMETFFRENHLLVLPSLWPEPFGQVGLEAGHFGLPVAAFDVGGVSTWLSDGVNGHLAPANPPTANGLAKAITLCLESKETHAQLSGGAVQTSQNFTMEKHLAELQPVLLKAVKNPVQNRGSRQP